MVLVVSVVVVGKGRGGVRPGLDVDVAVACFWGREEGVGGWGLRDQSSLKSFITYWGEHGDCLHFLLRGCRGGRRRRESDGGAVLV